MVRRKGAMKFLAKNENIGNIQVCEHGCVHVNLINGVSLFFTNEGFLSLASLTKRAAETMMNEDLAKLLSDPPQEEGEK
jgi:hypothetical protein